MEEEEKKNFFAELYQLDDDSDGHEDKSRARVILEQSKLLACQTKLQRQRLHKFDDLHQNHAQGRPVSAPTSRSASSIYGPSDSRQVLRKSTVTDPRRREGAGAQVVSSHTDAMTKGVKKADKKRKRGQSFDALPDSQQIFKGLLFFFFPNNDVAPSRAFRIRKAMEWGALWIKTWKEGITHVIVDRNLSYKDLLTFLKIKSIPPGIFVVNEGFPADCIRFRSVVNPRQLQYRVTGDDEPVRVRDTTSPKMASQTSLQVKPDKKDSAVLFQTPSRTEESGAQMPSSNSEQSKEEALVHVPDSLPSPMQYSNDALSEAIKDAQAVKDLPLDLDEDKDLSVDEADSSGSEEEHQVKNKPRSSFAKSWQDGFICMTKHDDTGKSQNPNLRTIEVLQQMADYYDRTRDHWRTTAYRKAISALNKQTRRIVTADQAFSIPSIGRRLADKIEEIVWTDRLRRLESTKLEPNDEVLQTFLKIYGVGTAQASRWIEQGYRSIDHLLVKANLTGNQRVGIDHFDDFQSRIPRLEMDQHDEYVRKTIEAIDSNIQIVIGGSYRRGARDSHDIDFIVTKPDCPTEVLRNVMVDTIIPYLFERSYLKVGLTTMAREDGTKWHGAATLPGHTNWRRVDFLMVPWEELRAALIYFTGNDIFNRSIRLLARKKGMRLNQRGLWKDVIRGKNGETTHGTLVESKDEKKIFESLGVPWRPPEHRMC